jgi:WD40 repeat protein
VLASVGGGATGAVVSFLVRAATDDVGVTVTGAGAGRRSSNSNSVPPLRLPSSKLEDDDHISGTGGPLSSLSRSSSRPLSAMSTRSMVSTGSDMSNAPSSVSLSGRRQSPHVPTYIAGQSITKHVQQLSSADLPSPIPSPIPSPTPSPPLLSGGGATANTPSLSEEAKWHEADYTELRRMLQMAVQQRRNAAAASSNGNDSQSSSHLEMVDHLSLLEHLWLRVSATTGHGLTERDFVDFLSEIFPSLSAQSLSMLFAKMDVDGDGALSWDEYLSYVLKEVWHKHVTQLARGAYILSEPDTAPVTLVGAAQRARVSRAIIAAAARSYEAEQRRLLLAKGDASSPPSTASANMDTIEKEVYGTELLTLLKSRSTRSLDIAAAAAAIDKTKSSSSSSQLVDEDGNQLVMPSSYPPSEAFMVRQIMVLQSDVATSFTPKYVLSCRSKSQHPIQVWHTEDRASGNTGGAASLTHMCDLPLRAELDRKVFTMRHETWRGAGIDESGWGDWITRERNRMRSSNVYGIKHETQMTQAELRAKKRDRTAADNEPSARLYPPPYTRRVWRRPLSASAVTTASSASKQRSASPLIHGVTPATTTAFEGVAGVNTSSNNIRPFSARRPAAATRASTNRRPQSARPSTIPTSSSVSSTASAAVAALIPRPSSSASNPPTRAGTPSVIPTTVNVLSATTAVRPTSTTSTHKPSMYRSHLLFSSSLPTPPESPNPTFASASSSLNDVRHMMMSPTASPPTSPPTTPGTKIRRHVDRVLTGDRPWNTTTTHHDHRVPPRYARSIKAAVERWVVPEATPEAEEESDRSSVTSDRTSGHTHHHHGHQPSMDSYIEDGPDVRPSSKSSQRLTNRNASVPLTHSQYTDPEDAPTRDYARRHLALSRPQSARSSSPATMSTRSSTHSRPQSARSIRSESSQTMDATSSHNGSTSGTTTMHASYDPELEQELGLMPFQRPTGFDGGMGHTCLAYYHEQRQIVVASMDKTINFYHLQFHQYGLVDRFRTTSIPQTITCGRAGHADKDLLVVGDTQGAITCFNIHTKRRVHVTQVHIDNAPFGDDAHMQSVQRVSLVPHLGLLSAGMDGRLAITDPDRWSVVRYFGDKLQGVGHVSGVYSFGTSEYYRCLLSAGFDRNVLVWSPLLNWPVGKLRGLQHTSQILDVLVNDERNQVITACVDKKIRIFDIRTWSCLHETMDTCRYHPHDQLSAIAFDYEHQSLVTAGDKVRVWPVVRAPGNQAKERSAIGTRATTSNAAEPVHHAHATSLVAVCHSSLFQQCITVTSDEHVRVWDMFSGRMVFEFATSHGTIVTSACLDHGGKRLLTGGHDGSVKIWNFSNGEMLRDVTPSRKSELVSLMYIPHSHRPIVGIGWERIVHRWSDSRRNNGRANHKLMIQAGHKSEITAMALHAPVSDVEPLTTGKRSAVSSSSTTAGGGSLLDTGGVSGGGGYTPLLATGTSDGEIITWFVHSGRRCKRTHLPHTPAMLTRAGVPLHLSAASSRHLIQKHTNNTNNNDPTSTQLHPTATSGRRGSNATSSPSMSRTANAPSPLIRADTLPVGGTSGRRGSLPFQTNTVTTPTTPATAATTRSRRLSMTTTVATPTGGGRRSSIVQAMIHHAGVSHGHAHSSSLDLSKAFPLLPTSAASATSTNVSNRPLLMSVGSSFRLGRTVSFRDKNKKKQLQQQQQHLSNHGRHAAAAASLNKMGSGRNGVNQKDRLITGASDSSSSESTDDDDSTTSEEDEADAKKRGTLAKDETEFVVEHATHSTSIPPLPTPSQPCTNAANQTTSGASQQPQPHHHHHRFEHEAERYGATDNDTDGVRPGVSAMCFMGLPGRNAILFAGTDDGCIHAFDPVTLKWVHSIIGVMHDAVGTLSCVPLDLPPPSSTVESPPSLASRPSIFAPSGTTSLSSSTSTPTPKPPSTMPSIDIPLSPPQPLRLIVPSSTLPMTPMPAPVTVSHLTIQLDTPTPIPIKPVITSKNHNNDNNHRDNITQNNTASAHVRFLSPGVPTQATPPTVVSSSIDDSIANDPSPIPRSPVPIDSKRTMKSTKSTSTSTLPTTPSPLSSFRVLATDLAKEGSTAYLWHVQNISENVHVAIRCVLIRSWKPHSASNSTNASNNAPITTCARAIIADGVHIKQSLFGLGGSNGSVSLWTIDGEPLASFGQSERFGWTWPIKGKSLANATSMPQNDDDNDDNGDGDDDIEPSG